MAYSMPSLKHFRLNEQRPPANDRGRILAQGRNHGDVRGHSVLVVLPAERPAK